MRDIQIKARNSTRAGAFGVGRGSMTAMPADQDAGGPNLANPYADRTQSGGEAYNKGRLNGGTEVHHNGGTATIKVGSTEPSR